MSRHRAGWRISSYPVCPLPLKCARRRAVQRAEGFVGNNILANTPVANGLYCNEVLEELRRR
jgi:hypothetical protein